LILRKINGKISSKTNNKISSQTENPVQTALVAMRQPQTYSAALPKILTPP
jgi:hypothetical protein